MSETNDFKNFKRRVAQYPDRIERVENLFVVGMPDVNFCIRGVEGWIEFKSPTEPKKESTPLFGSNHKVSQDQMNWMLCQRLAGGNAYFFISTDKNNILINSSYADDLNDMTVQEIINASVWHEPTPVKNKKRWIELRKALIDER